MNKERAHLVCVGGVFSGGKAVHNLCFWEFLAVFYV